MKEKIVSWITQRTTQAAILVAVGLLVNHFAPQYSELVAQIVIATGLVTQDKWLKIGKGPTK